MTPPRFCRCSAPRPITDAEGHIACDECGELVDAGMVKRDRIIVSLARQVRDLRQRVSELEARTPNTNGIGASGGRSNGNSAGQLRLEEITG
jgi:hypothetical protein